jgi:hypothetical protein
MALSDTVRIAIIEETTEGVTPATPAFDLMRVNSDTLQIERESVNDPELNSARTLRDVIPTSRANRGAIETNLARNTVFENILAGIFGGAWVSDDLVTGTTRKTFTIEKTFLNANNRQTYHRYRGVMPSSLQLVSNPDEPVRATWSFVGGTFEVAQDASTIGDAEITGATYVEPSPAHDAAPAMRGQDVVVSTSGSQPMALTIWTAMDLTIDSQVLATKQLGVEGESSLHLGKFICPVQATIVFRNQTPDTLAESGGRIGLTVNYFDRIASPAQNLYSFAFTDFVITNAPTPTPATGELLVQEITGEIVTPSSGEFVTLSRSVV